MNIFPITYPFSETEKKQPKSLQLNINSYYPFSSNEEYSINFECPELLELNKHEEKNFQTPATSRTLDPEELTLNAR